MAGVQGSALAVAVSSAGGLGSLPGAVLGPDALRKELAAIRAQTTKPFNVNFFCHTRPEPNAEQEAIWRARLLPYFAELGVDASAIPTGPGRLPFSDEAADVLDEFRPAVVSFHFGLPPEALLSRVRRGSAKILSSATTVDEARWLEARGVDAVIAQGIEAGGHRGSFLSDDLSVQLGTFALVPRIVDAVEDPRHRRGRHRGREGCCGRHGPRCGRRADRDGVPVVPRGHHEQGASRGPRERRSQHHGAHQPLQWATRSGHREPPMARELGPMSGAVPAFPLATSVIAPCAPRPKARAAATSRRCGREQNASGCKAVPAADLTRQLAGALPGAHADAAQPADGSDGRLQRPRFIGRRSTSGLGA